MREKIKRSMAVYPSPIVFVDGTVQVPEGHGLYVKTKQGKWTGEWGYRITRVTNSIEYDPGAVLAKEHIQRLIEDGWTVTVLTGE